MITAASLFSRDGLEGLGFRWLHILAGITWIGLLYYFNFVQVPSFAAYGTEGDGPKARNIALNILARRALWWFRWAAVATFLTGIIIVGLGRNYFGGGLKVARNSGILTGMLLGTIMLLNVWGVIWRNQKVVLGNAAGVLEGKPADPGAAAAGRRAAMASRQNTLFSISMLYFMVFRSHAVYDITPMSSGKTAAYWIISLVIIAVFEINALGLMPWKAGVGKGLNWCYESVQNVLISAFVLWAFFMIFWEILAA